MRHLHAELIEDCKTIRDNRDTYDNYISLNHYIRNGYRVFIFTSVGAPAMLDGYGPLSLIRDILGLSSSHAGSFGNPYFVDDWNAIKKKVIDFISQDISKPIILAGHGVGGAVAMLAGYDLLKKQIYNVDEVVTFGAPKAINSANIIPRHAYKLRTIATQYALTGDRYPKMFTWSRYRHLNVTPIHSYSVTPGIDPHSVNTYYDALQWVLEGVECFR